MTLTVDLNSDMGEGFGPWKMTDDSGLLRIVTSANIACGFQAGDADTMAATMGMAAKANVGIGAHPGFPDLQGFGRRQMQVPLPTLANMVRYQVSAAIGKADDLYHRGAGEMAVCRTEDGNIEVLSEFSLAVRHRDVTEVIYTASYGFFPQPPSAA